MRKVKIELDEDVVNALISKKTVGLSYSDVLRPILGLKKKAEK